MYRIAILVENNLFFYYECTIVVESIVLGTWIITCTCIHVGSYITILRLIEFATIMSKSRIGKNRLKEIATNRERSTRTLSESTCTEVNATIFASYPSTNYKLRTNTYEPSVGMVVGSTSLTTKFGILELSHIAPKTLRSSSRFHHTTLEKLLHEECTLVRNYLFCILRSTINLFSITVYNTCHQYRSMMTTIISYGTIRVGKFEEVHIT